jgi:hypothetical protein
MNQLGVIMKMQGLQNEMQANRLQAQKYQQEIATSQATERKTRLEAKRDAFQRGAAMAGDNPELLMGLLTKASQDPDLSEYLGGIGPQHLQFIGGQLNDPAKVKMLANRMRGMSPEDEAKLAQPQTTLGKLQAELAQIPLGDPRRGVYEAAINKETRFAPTEAGGLPADARMIEWLKSQDPDTQALYRQMFGKGDTGKVAQVITDNAGNVRMFTASGEEVIPKTAAGAPPPKGKPSATFEKTAAQRKQLALDLDRAIIELSTAAEDGGLIDQSTGSGLGQLADTAAGVIGQATPGAIAISKLQPIADLVLKMVPRFEGPQSDKDTQSYKEAAGQLANGNLPNAIRKAAAREIVRLMTERKGQFVSPAMADEGTSARETAAGTSSEDDPVARAAKLLDKYPGK